MKILEDILIDKQNRTALIKKFQNLIWDDDNANEVLLTLAYDLDFYEPNYDIRKDDIVYYGDERLETEIKIALQKLRKTDE